MLVNRTAVGQGTWEEINYQPSTSPGGENYGWRLKEIGRRFHDGVADQCSAESCCQGPTVGDINQSGGVDITDISVLTDNQYPGVTLLRLSNNLLKHR